MSFIINIHRCSYNDPDMQENTYKRLDLFLELEDPSTISYTSFTVSTSSLFKKHDFPLCKAFTATLEFPETRKRF